MSHSKTIIIGTSVGALVVMVVIVSVFTNIDDLVSKETAEFTSEIILTNPVQSYEVNTECDFVNFVFNQQKAREMVRFLYISQEAIQQETLEKTKALQKDRFIETAKEITVPMIMEEFSINPNLKEFIVESFSGTTNDYALLAKVKLLDPRCEIYESTVNANKELSDPSKRETISSKYEIPEFANMPQTASGGPKDAGPLGSEHSHSTILVKILGDELDFSVPAYQIKSSWIHFEARDGSTIHKHATGVTLGYLFETLKLGLDDQCFRFQDGRNFCTNGEYSLKFYINGEQMNDIRDYEPMEGDDIRIVYGSDNEKTLTSSRSDTSESLDNAEKNTDENHYELTVNNPITSGPFQIDHSKYLIGEKIIIKARQLDPNEKGEITLLRSINGTHYSTYETIPFDGKNEASFEHDIEINLSESSSMCSVEDIAGEWTMVFRGTDYPNLKFEIINDIAQGVEESFVPIC